MSFDLFVILGDTDKTTQKQWVKGLQTFGFECRFPDGFIIGQTDEPETLVQCKINPPYVKTATAFEEYDFSFAPHKIQEEERAEMIAAIDDTKIQQIVQSSKSKIHLYSSAGRSDDALTLQCFSAATLAYTSGGLVFDPQEFGVLHGKEVFKIIQHSGFKVNATSESNSKSDTSQNGPNSNQTKSFSNSIGITMVVLFIIIVLTIRHFTDKF